MGELKFDPRKMRKWIPLPLGHESHYDFNVFFLEEDERKKRHWMRENDIEKR